MLAVANTFKFLRVNSTLAFTRTLRIPNYSSSSSFLALKLVLWTLSFSICFRQSFLSLPVGFQLRSPTILLPFWAILSSQLNLGLNHPFSIRSLAQQLAGISSALSLVRWSSYLSRFKLIQAFYWRLLC